jgi:hypothetical protein
MQKLTLGYSIQNCLCITNGPFIMFGPYFSCWVQLNKKVGCLQAKVSILGCHNVIFFNPYGLQCVSCLENNYFNKRDLVV